MRAVGIELAANKVLDEEYDEARRLFAKVLEFNPNDAHVLCLLANVFILEEDFKTAKEWLDKALRTNPNYPWVSYHMGKEDFDDIKEANVVLQKSLKAWNEKIVPKRGAKLERMKTKDKVILFKDTKCD